MVFGVYVYAFQGQFTINPANQGISKFGLQTAGNVLVLIPGLIVGALYGNIGIKASSGVLLSLVVFDGFFSFRLSMLLLWKTFSMDLNCLAALDVSFGQCWLFFIGSLLLLFRHLFPKFPTLAVSTHNISRLYQITNQSSNTKQVLWVSAIFQPQNSVSNLHQLLCVFFSSRIPSHLSYTPAS